MPFLTPTAEINDLSQRVANLTGLPTRWLSSFEREIWITDWQIQISTAEIIPITV